MKKVSLTEMKRILDTLPTENEMLNVRAYGIENPKYHPIQKRQLFLEEEVHKEQSEAIDITFEWTGYDWILILPDFNKN